MKLTQKAIAAALLSTSSVVFAEQQHRRRPPIRRATTVGSLAQLRRRLVVVEHARSAAGEQLERLSARVADLERDTGAVQGSRADNGAELTPPPYVASCALIVVKDKAALSDLAARLVGEALGATADATRGPRVLLPTGTTPLGKDGLFSAMLRLQRAGPAALPASPAGSSSFERLRVVGGDEYGGVPPSDAGSFHAYTTRRVLVPLGCDRAEALLLDGGAADADAECARYEASLAADPLDLAVLGLGLNGHLAFNDPPAGPATRTRVLPLRPESVETSKADFPGRDVALLPTHALSIGMGTLSSPATCARCVVLVSGAKKAAALRRALEDDYVGEMFPASQARGWRHLTVIADEAAAAHLSTRLRARIGIDMTRGGEHTRAQLAAMLWHTQGPQGHRVRQQPSSGADWWTGAMY
eukprot:g7173.t1